MREHGERLHISEKRRIGHVTSGGWERTIAEHLHISETSYLPNVGVFTPYRETCHRTSGSEEHLHISETMRLDAQLS